MSLPSLSTILGRPLRRAASALHRLGDNLADLERRARFTRGCLEFVPRTDDIWVVTYPRSGTTWMQYMLHLLFRPDEPFEHIDDVCPWFERNLALGVREAADFDALSSPRIFKSHLLPRWAPTTGRFIHLRREPAAVLRSYHALYQSYLGYRDPLPTFTEFVLSGRAQYGSWLDHVEAWERPQGRTVLRLRYETLRGDPVATMRAVAAFLGAPDDRVETIVEHGSISEMRHIQTKFDHATALLRERGIRPGDFIRTGTPHDDAPWIAQALDDARRGRRPRPNLGAFLR